VITAFLVASALSGATPPADRWFGEDKLRHFFSSFVITSVAASGARATGLTERQSLAVGIGVGGGLGIWKEVRDMRRPGETASIRDLVWDAAGVAAAAVVVRQGGDPHGTGEPQLQPNP
jgi:uncharacterized protein YfiM (DUF2279 family)